MALSTKLVPKCSFLTTSPYIPPNPLTCHLVSNWPMLLFWSSSGLLSNLAVRILGFCTSYAITWTFCWHCVFCFFWEPSKGLNNYLLTCDAYLATINVPKKVHKNILDGESGLSSGWSRHSSLVLDGLLGSNPLALVKALLILYCLALDCVR